MFRCGDKCTGKLAAEARLVREKVCYDNAAKEKDARMMFEFDTNNRSYRKQKFIMDQVIDITSTYDKQLPGQIGLPEGEVNQLQEFKVKLPEGEGQPVKIK